MSRKRPYIHLAGISVVISVIVGIWFHDTSYFTKRLDEVQVEISKEQYITKLADTQNEQTLIKEQSFNLTLAIISWLLTFSFGLILFQFRGPNVKRVVKKPTEHPKDSHENIRDNINPDSTFMG